MSKPISAHAETLRLLRENQMKAKKHFGQNFIIDPTVVMKIAQHADIVGQEVIEVGPGLGALTQQLAALAKHVTAYEIDPDCVAVLTPFFADSNVSIVHQDFLTTHTQDIHATHLVGNLPYYITTPILFHILEQLPQIKVVTIMVQKEVAERFHANVNTKDYNALSIILSTLCEIKTVMKVNRNVFHPKPNVDSAVVQFRRREGVDTTQLKPYFDFVKLAFTQRRKTLVNNLKSLPNVLAVLEDMALSPSIRAEALTQKQFEELYRRLS